MIDPLTLTAGGKLLGLLRRFWFVLPIVGLAIALAVQTARLDHRTGERDVLQAWQALTVEATRAAAAHPKLGVAHVPAQIAELGRGLAKLKEGLATCTRTAQAAADNDRQRQARAAAELEALKKQDAARVDLIGRLQASAARPRPPAPPGSCPRSDVSPTLKGIWR